MPSLVEIGSFVIEEEMKCEKFTDRQTDGRRTTAYLSFQHGMGFCAGAWSYNENAMFFFSSSCLHWGIDQSIIVYSNDNHGRG